MVEQSAVTQRVGVTSARLAISRLNPAAGLDGMLRRACEISARALNVDRVGVWLFNEDHSALMCRLQHGGDPGETLLEAAAPRYFAELRHSRILAVEDAQHDDRTRQLNPYLQLHGITALLDAPIYREGNVVGVLCHERQGRAREFTDAERHFAATVADMAAYFFELEQRLEAQAAAHRLELKLSESHRLDTLADFSAGVAHDIGNLLGVIAVALDGLSKMPQTRELVDVIRSAVDRGRALTVALVRFAKRGAPNPELLSRSELTQRIERAAAPVIRTPWSLAIDLAPQVSLWAEPMQFEQVVHNLVGNAIDAMPQGGVVLVRVLAAEAGARLEVIDTGVGISSENQTKLFTPFFTTKHSGTGLGLATVEFVAHRHGGTVNIESTPGDGTTVKVFWPEKPPAEVSKLS